MLALQKSNLEREKTELIEKYDKIKEKLKATQIRHEEEISEVFFNIIILSFFVVVVTKIFNLFSKNNLVK
jgi:hypothetical protein